MNKLLHLSLAAAVALLTGCVVAPYPTAYPTGATTPPSFDRSWDAALGAAADVGIQVTRADRAAGRIGGVKAGAAVTIELQPQADPLPWELRLPVARDPVLLNAVSRVSFEEVREWLRARDFRVPEAARGPALAD